VKRKSLADTLKTPAAAGFIQGKAGAPASKQVIKLTSKQMIAVRLDADLEKRLRLAAGERKAERTAPYYVQDIIAEAVQAWLKSKGY
jgi:hypothetical protein